MNSSARDSILQAIRSNLTASARHDAVYSEDVRSRLQEGPGASLTGGQIESVCESSFDSLIEVFKQNLEAVGGHCRVAQSEIEVKETITRVVSELQESDSVVRRIAISNAPALRKWFNENEVDVDEVTITPDARDLFDYDVGISTAQIAIAETGTLLLESEAERHRLVSLVPPVHIAIVEAADICLTLAEALAKIATRGELSRTITLITGPSRTGDIELTLTIGVHGPQKLYVIVNKGSATSQ